MKTASQLIEEKLNLHEDEDSSLKLLGESEKLIEFLVGDLRKNMQHAYSAAMNMNRAGGSPGIQAAHIMSRDMPKWLDEVKRKAEVSIQKCKKAGYDTEF